MNGRHPARAQTFEHGVAPEAFTPMNHTIARHQRMFRRVAGARQVRRCTAESAMSLILGGTSLAAWLRMRGFLLPVLAACAFATGCSDDDDDDFVDATLLVVNESDFAIVEIFLTEVGNPDWGPNLLRGDVLLPGEDFLLGVDCDFYDALLVDEDGVECEVLDIDLCLNDANWIVTNNTCAIFGAKAKERALQASQSLAR
jgi:hypothetical protein